LGGRGSLLVHDDYYLPSRRLEEGRGRKHPVDELQDLAQLAMGCRNFKKKTLSKS
jgi:hypothetical protein